MTKSLNFTAVAVLLVGSWMGSAQFSDALAASGLTLEEALATGFCDEGDVACLEELMIGDEDSSSDSGSSSDDKSSDDDSSKDHDSKSDDKSSDDGSSKDHDSKSDDKSSDDDSSSDDGSSDPMPPLPNVVINDGQGTEFNNVTNVPVVLTVSLDVPAPGPVLIDWATQDGTAVVGNDYLAAAGQISFSAGQQSADLTVFIIGDDTSEPAESFFVRLTTAEGVVLLDDQGEVVIFDDDDIDE
ncbi:MAG: hypothetical protein HKN06_07420 [Gammaproteobacteria bacterium]|nr:hypothetical protein [Gammaproteobacteria bacterium]